MLIGIKLLIWLVAPIANAWRDRKGGKPFYLVVNIFRGMVMLVHGSLFIPPWAWEGWFYYWWPVAIFEITSFWLVFEIALWKWWNHYHPKDKKPFLYYDHKEGDSGLADRFFAWAGFKVYVACKLAAFIAMVLSIYILYSRG